MRPFENEILGPYILYMNTNNYTSPEIEVIEIVAEGVICASGYAGDSEDVELF